MHAPSKGACITSGQYIALSFWLVFSALSRIDPTKQSRASNDSKDVAGSPSLAISVMEIFVFFVFVSTHRRTNPCNISFVKLYPRKRLYIQSLSFNCFSCLAILGSYLFSFLMASFQYGCHDDFLFSSQLKHGSLSRRAPSSIESMLVEHPAT